MSSGDLGLPILPTLAHDSYSLPFSWHSLAMRNYLKREHSNGFPFVTNNIKDPSPFANMYFLIITWLVALATTSSIDANEFIKRDCTPSVIPDTSKEGTWIQVCDDFCTATSGANCNSNTESDCCVSSTQYATCRRKFVNIMGPAHWQIESCNNGMTCNRWQDEGNYDVMSTCGNP